MSSAEEQSDAPVEGEAARVENQPSADAAAEAPEAAAADDEPAPQPKWWEDFRDFYLTFDRRTLGLTRILLGFFALFDLFRRTDDWWKMYSNEGVLPTHFNLWRPQSSGWSIFNAFAMRAELWALWGFGFAVFFCLLIGYKTKVMQIIAAIFVASMNGRVLLIENGGYVVHNLLFLWTAFLPLGDRFSVDALLASMKTQRERGVVDLNDRQLDTAKWRLKPHVTFVSFILTIQLAAIYAFNVMHKEGPAWHDGTAVHYVLWVDRMVNPFIAVVRGPAAVAFKGWIILILTKSVMGMEAGLPLALLSPLARVWAKRVALLFMNLLHIGFGTTFVLGPFAWALCVFSSLLVSREDWELAIRTMRRRHRARTVRFDPRDEAMFFWCRMLKRCDKFALLRFKGDKTAVGLAVTTPEGKTKDGSAALYDIVDALPGGTCIAWLAPLWLGIGWLVNRIAGFGTRKAKKQKVKVGYRPELKDDDGVPTVDAYYMGKWLDAFDRKWLAWWRIPLSIPATALVGAFVLTILATVAGGLSQILRDDIYRSLPFKGEQIVEKLLKAGPYLLAAPTILVLVLVVLGLVQGQRYRVPGWLFGGLALFGGLFLYVYGAPMLRRFQVDVTTVMFGGEGSKWTRERVMNWTGAAAAIAGAVALFLPFLVMNVATPSTLQRKWLRVGAVSREVFATVMFCGAINQAVCELWKTKWMSAPQPEATRMLAHKLRYLQGWFMFSPNPVMDDGTIITDCVTVDGRRIDPLSTDALRAPKPLPPDMDILHAQSYGYNQIWSDYYNRMHLAQNSSFRNPMKDYIFRLPERTGNPNDACVKGAVYWVHDMNPRFRQTKSFGYNRDELFRFMNPDMEVQQKYAEWLAAHGGEDPPEAPLPVPLPPAPQDATPRN